MKAMTGAKGNPLANMVAKIGMAAKEPKGEMAPRILARKMEGNPEWLKARARLFCEKALWFLV